MQIISLGDVKSLISGKKKNLINVSFAVFAHSVLKVNE